MPKRHIEPDLLVIVIFTLILIPTVLAFPVSWLRITLGFLFITFFPGYVLVAALFPGKRGISGMTRIALSLGLSIVIAILIGLLLGCTPWGIGLASLLISLSLFILLASGLSWYLRGRISPEERFRLSLGPPLTSLVSNFRAAGRPYQGLVMVLILAILGGSGALGYDMAKSLDRQSFTEFYLLGTEGRAADYPQELSQGEEGRVIVGIVNHEYQEMDYWLEVMVDGDKLYELPPIKLMPEGKWERAVGFAIPKIGSKQKVEFRLYKSDQLSETRYLWVNVGA